jgi:two-component system phosphate regulon sensor histidine kinase PhoR
MRLAHRLLLYVLAIVAVLVIAVVLIIDNRLQARVIEQTIDGLAREATLVGAQWRDRNAADSVADVAGSALGHRVTLVDEGGAVLGDSEFDGDALRALENHNGRPEIALARTARLGSARRMSSSAGDEEFYVAVRAPLGVARVSLPTRSLEAVFDRTRGDVFVAGAIALALAALLAIWFSRSVSRPVEELRDVAREIADGDLTRRPTLSAPGEIGDLATALYRLAEQLGARMTALETDRALLAAVVTSLEEGVIAVDSGDQVVQANDAARRLLGISASIPFSVDLLPREPLLRDALSDAMRGARSGPIEISLNGHTLLLTANALRHGGAVLALSDVTSTRKLEAVRRDFVANVSHELRTPLTVIAGFSETLGEEGVSPAQRRQFSEMIVNNTTRMQRIVDDLLDLSRIESGGWIPNPKLVNVADAVEDVMTGLRANVAQKGIEFEARIDPGARDVYADRTALGQILSNLLENAIRYTSHGTVALESKAVDGGVEISVSDSGTGIAAKHLPRIFERFYRVDSGRARESGGTGLGLSIVRHLVDAHGGRIDARSTEGAGTTIKVFFPSH